MYFYTFHFIDDSLDFFLEFELWNEIISAFEWKTVPFIFNIILNVITVH